MSSSHADLYASIDTALNALSEGRMTIVAALVKHVKASWRNVLEGARPRLDASAQVRVSDERPSVQRIAA
jgi:hypothetical protein